MEELHFHSNTNHQIEFGNNTYQMNKKFGLLSVSSGQ
jgi:hypothetical protein